ncbi:MAG: lipoyl synthase [Leptospirales bacterium]
MKLPINLIAPNPFDPIRMVSPPGPKPAWLRVPSPASMEVLKLRTLFRNSGLHTVCEEAHCPNIGECFQKGTATFMILGNICTRACPFCDVDHGKPLPVDPEEPSRLAKTVSMMGLSYVVITSVDRDDLQDGGATQFTQVIRALRTQCPSVRIEILVPDFRGCLHTALHILEHTPPDLFNHNLETVPRLYRSVRPGANYQHSLDLLSSFHKKCPAIPTKSGIMLGLGEEKEEVLSVLKDLRQAGCSMVTIGQYLPPSRDHLPVHRYVTPDEFLEWELTGIGMGFDSVASGPLVRSSYHAEQSASGLERPERQDNGETTEDLCPDQGSGDTSSDSVLRLEKLGDFPTIIPELP